MEISRFPANSPIIHRHRAAARREEEARAANSHTQTHEVPPEDDLNPVAMLQRFINSTDEMSSAMAQFRNRRDLKKMDSDLDNFERVLEKDVLPKVQQVLKFAAAAGVTSELLAQLRSMFPDDSDLILILRALLKRRQIEETSRKRLEQVLVDVERGAVPRRVKAGINCAIKARMFGKLLQRSPALLRESYRQFLDDEQGPTAAYTDWVLHYGFEHREQILNFIEAALANDVMAQDPSCDFVEFGNLLKKLVQVRMLRSAEIIFLANLLRHPLIRRCNEVEIEWLIFMLGILQAPEEIDQSLHEVLGQNLILCTHAERTTILQLIRDGFHNVPLELFPEIAAVHELLMRLDELSTLAHDLEVIERRRGPDNLE